MWKQTDVLKKQYKKLDKVHGFNKTLTNKKHENSNLVYNKFNTTDEEFSADTKSKCFEKFSNDTNQLWKVNSRDDRMKKNIVDDEAPKFFNE